MYEICSFTVLFPWWIIQTCKEYYYCIVKHYFIVFVTKTHPNTIVAGIGTWYKISIQRFCSYILTFEMRKHSTTIRHNWFWSSTLIAYIILTQPFFTMVSSWIKFFAIGTYFYFQEAKRELRLRLPGNKGPPRSLWDQCLWHSHKSCA